MITIRPGTPTSADQVEFEFVGGSGCPKITKAVTDSHFHFDVSNANGPCLSTRIPYTFSWNVGTIAAGDYQVTQTEKQLVLDTQVFSVSQAKQDFPAAAVPLLGTPAMILLAVAVAWLANKAVRTNKQKRAA